MKFALWKGGDSDSTNVQITEISIRTIRISRIARNEGKMQDERSGKSGIFFSTERIN